MRANALTSVNIRVISVPPGVQRSRQAICDGGRYHELEVNCDVFTGVFHEHAELAMMAILASQASATWDILELSFVPTQVQ